MNFLLRLTCDQGHWTPPPQHKFKNLAETATHCCQSAQQVSWSWLLFLLRNPQLDGIPLVWCLFIISYHHLPLFWFFNIPYDVSMCPPTFLLCGTRGCCHQILTCNAFVIVISHAVSQVVKHEKFLLLTKRVLTSCVVASHIWSAFLHEDLSYYYVIWGVN